TIYGECVFSVPGSSPRLDLTPRRPQANSSPRIDFTQRSQQAHSLLESTSHHDVRRQTPYPLSGRLYK
ncbi:hypothetical protein J6590_104469, partial [Homalodisca vitripennis]